MDRGDYWQTQMTRPLEWPSLGSLGPTMTPSLYPYRLRYINHTKHMFLEYYGRGRKEGIWKGVREGENEVKERFNKNGRMLEGEGGREGGRKETVMH